MIKISLFIALLSVALISVLADDDGFTMTCPCICRGGPNRPDVRKNCRRFPLRNCVLRDCRVSKGGLTGRIGSECCDPDQPVSAGPSPKPSQAAVEIPAPSMKPCPCKCMVMFRARRDCRLLPGCTISKCDRMDRFPKFQCC